MYPQYQNLDITKYFTSWGFYTLGFIQRHRPDIELIPLRFKNFNESIEPHSKTNYDWLKPSIEQSLAQGKIVALLPEDEFVSFETNTQLTNIVNEFADRPLYWITHFDSATQHIRYYIYHGLRCRMIELPWSLLNDCLTYYRVQQSVVSNPESHHNFLCMVNNPAGHKFQLLSALQQAGLTSHGKITLTNAVSGYEFCEINPYYPYSNIPPGCTAIGACVLINGVWISKNVENYLHIEQMYNHIPLVINPETTTFPFMSTEKSIWPALLGHLFLVWGRPGTMAWIQKFYDVDIGSWANVDYDSITWPDDGRATWHEDQRQQRSLKYMLRQNRDLIISAGAVRNQLRPQLEAARWTFGQNMYNFFVEQLKRIA